MKRIRQAEEGCRRREGSGGPADDPSHPLYWQDRREAFALVNEADLAQSLHALGDDAGDLFHARATLAHPTAKAILAAQGRLPDLDAALANPGFWRRFGKLAAMEQGRIDHCYDDTSEWSAALYVSNAGGFRYGIVSSVWRWGAVAETDSCRVDTAETKDEARRLFREAIEECRTRVDRTDEIASERLIEWERRQMALCGGV